MHEDNVLDRRLAALPRSDLAALDDRYKSLVAEPGKLKFIDRLVADSRAVGLNHVAGLSCPQQVQMALFSLFALIDERDEYKAEMKHIIRQRYHNLYRHVGADRGDDVNAVDYYTLIDLEALGEQRHGRAFADWLLANKEPTRAARTARRRGWGCPAPRPGLWHAASVGAGLAREPARRGLRADRRGREHDPGRVWSFQGRRRDPAQDAESRPTRRHHAKPR